MRPNLSQPIALLVSMLLIAGCATSPPPVAPPRLKLPDAAAQPCPLAVLPPNPTQGDLDAAYITRGAQVVACDAARQLAVDTRAAEHQLIDEWLKLQADRQKGWLSRLFR